MSIDTRFMPAIRNALLEKMQDTTGRQPAESGQRVADDRGGHGTDAADSVSLSADALRVHAAISFTAGEAVFDAERVAELRLAITSGVYRIDADRVAEKFRYFNAGLAGGRL
ncbi:MAG: flagellar biosynthesis anti-sigma factor FlgM [Thiohalobacterales bacterium]|nr:flagellar biosynthesis anti-sigma factor FlgM [Thiohalobacterales bacterium]